MDSPLNPNFWKCACGIRNALLESYCDICHVIQEDGQPATQQEVNAHADLVATQQKKAREKKHELPQPRKKPVPTRDEFEKALDVLERVQMHHDRYMQTLPDSAKKAAEERYQRSKQESKEYFIIKRYKALA